MIVADSNLVAYLLIPGDKSADSERLLMKDPEWAVPMICRSEIRNILTLYMRHQKMSLAQAMATMEMAEALWRNREYAVPSNEVLALTSKCKLSAYDAEFVVLAQQLNVPLVTHDTAVRKLFPRLVKAPSEI